MPGWHLPGSSVAWSVGRSTIPKAIILSFDFPWDYLCNLIEKTFSGGNDVVLRARLGFVCPKDLFDCNSGCPSMQLRPVVLLPLILPLVLCPSNNLRAQTTTSGGLTGVVTD